MFFGNFFKESFLCVLKFEWGDIFLEYLSLKKSLIVFIKYKEIY